MIVGSCALLVIQDNRSKIATSEERMETSKILVNQWGNERSSRDQLSHPLVFTKSAQEPDCGPERVLYCEPSVQLVRAATPSG
jgi:hypothetical protein